MNDDIKEMLELHIKNDIDLLPKNQKTVLDYITNLQQENEKLKETNVYCNRTDCVGRIKDSKKYDSVYQEKEDYKSRIEKADWWLKEMLKQTKSDETKAIINGTLELLLNGRSDE